MAYRACFCIFATSMEPFKAPQKNKYGLLLGNCLGMLLLTFLLVGGAFYGLRLYTHHGEEIKMPNLHGKSFEVAKQTLKEMGLTAEIVDTGFVRTLPPNVILSQSILPGASIKSGRVVMLTINAAHAIAVALPDVADNCSRREAEARLKALGFKLTPPKLIVGDRDWVYGIEVNGKNVITGQRISVDIPITLVVGNGSGTEEYNGNDSLDYFLNGLQEETDESVIDEGIE